jgi:hypothetical protein
MPLRWKVMRKGRGCHTRAKHKGNNGPNQYTMGNHCTADVDCHNVTFIVTSSVDVWGYWN